MAPSSGIVSYTFDDFKKELSLENEVDTFTGDYLSGVKIDPLTRGKNQVKEGQAFFRTISDTAYKIALPVDDARLVKDEMGQKVMVRIGKVMTEARVESVVGDDNSPVVILSLQDKLQEVYRTRRQKTTIIKSESPAMKVPTTAIVSGKHGEKGVYVDAVRRFVTFVPVEVLSIRDKEAYISMGDDKGMIKNKKGEDVTTLRPTDEVIAEPKKVRQDKIVY